VTDRKLAIDNGDYNPETGTYYTMILGGDGVVDYFTSDVVSQSDYYPFGMMLPGRNSSEEEYRYGYQGSEMDNEVKDSKGTSYTTEFRQLNPRVGRWLSIDPKATAWESPYVSMGNNPIFYNDVNGDTIFSKRFLGRTLKHENGQVFKKNGEVYDGKLRGLHADAQNRLTKLSSRPNGKDLVEDLEQSEHNVTIKRTRGGRDFNRAIDYNNSSNSLVGSGSVLKISKEGVIEGVEGFIVLGHELQHARDNAEGTSIGGAPWYILGGVRVVDKDEIAAVHIENLIRTEHGLPLRMFYTIGYEVSRTVKPDGTSVYYNVDYQNTYLQNIQEVREILFPEIPLPSMK
jgi:RHS repeat-associated protein